MTDIIAAQSKMPASYQEMLAKLEPETNLTGSYSSNRRLSIRGGVFRKVVNGQEVGEVDARALSVVIVKSAPVSRTYYAGAYTPGETSAPACWSSDTQTQKPADAVPEETRQASRCTDCPQNIKGSGQGDSRACRYQQRVAVLLANEDGDLESSEPYLLSLPATSVFGDNQRKMSMQAYARHLNAHKTPLASVITELRFDTDSSTPKLWFKPIRPLTEKELAIAVEVQSNENTAELVALKYSQAKSEIAGEEPASGSAALPPLFGPSADEDAPEDEPKAAAKDDEPTVRKSKKKEAKSEKADLASLLDELDQFDD